LCLGSGAVLNPEIEALGTGENYPTARDPEGSGGCFERGDTTGQLNRLRQKKVRRKYDPDLANPNAKESKQVRKGA